jgi:hypothetical protein
MESSSKVRTPRSTSRAGSTRLWLALYRSKPKESFRLYPSSGVVGRGRRESEREDCSGHLARGIEIEIGATSQVEEVYIEREAERQR